jgi:hypothetical protein
VTKLSRVLDVKLRGQTITEGDLVKVKPFPGRRDGFDATFVHAWVNDGGLIHFITVFGGRGDAKTERTYPPERISTYRAKTQEEKRRA